MNCSAPCTSRRGSYGDAIAELQAAAGLAPQDATIQQLLAGAYSNAGRDDLAQQAGQRALALLQAPAGGAEREGTVPGGKIRRPG